MSQTSVSIEDYGAVPFSATVPNPPDVAGPLGDALAAAAGLPVVIPPKKFKLSSTVTVPANSTIVSTGGELAVGTVGALLFRNDCHVAGVTFSGAYKNGALSGQNVVSILSASRCTVSGCRFLNLAGRGLQLKNAEDTRIDGNEFKTIAGCGVWLDAASGNRATRRTFITNNRFDDCQRSDTAGNAAIQARGPGNPAQVVFVGNNTITGGHVGVGLDWVAEASIFNNRISNCKGEGVALTGTDVSVQGNHITDCKAAGILVFHGLAPTLESQPPHGPSGPQGSGRFLIANNRVLGCAQGVALVWADDGVVMTDILVTGNVLRSNRFGVQSYPWFAAVNPQIGYDNVNVTGNDLSGNTTAATNFLAAAPAVTFVRAWNNITQDFDTVVDGGTGLLTSFTFAGLRSLVGPATDGGGIHYALAGLWAPDITPDKYPRKIRYWIGYDKYKPGERGAGIEVDASGEYANASTARLIASYGSGPPGTVLPPGALPEALQWRSNWLHEPELGFFGASAITKPTVTGSNANEALTSLLTQLAKLGLITDDSSL